jgi:hypothetical protein
MKEIPLRYCAARNGWFLDMLGPDEKKFIEDLNCES